MRRVVVVLTLLAASVLAATAGATQPVKTTFDGSRPETLRDVCSFDVAVLASAHVTETDFFDAGGALTRSSFHITEQDTFSANGKSLTGLPFTFNVEMLFDAAGNVAHFYTSGVFQKLVLPSGTIFLSAGRADGVAHPGIDFLLSPDKGNPGDVAAFCAALS